MPKILQTLFLPLLFCWGNYLHAQTIASIFPDSAHQNDVVNVTITGTGTNFTAGTGAFSTRLNLGTNNIYSTSMSVINPTTCTAEFTIPPLATPGMWNMEVVGYTVNAPSIFEITGIFPSTQYMYVSGTVYADINSNGIFDGSDYPLPGTPVRFAPGNNVTTSDNNGNYGKWVPLGNYSVNHAQRSYFISAPSRNISLLIPGDTLPGQNFALQVTNAGDLGLTLSATVSRIGFYHTVSANVKNFGSLSQGGTLYALMDTTHTTLAATFSTPPTGISGDTVWWTLPTLAHGQSYLAQIIDSIPASSSVGTRIFYKSWVVAGTQDNNVLNDIRYFNQFLTASWDPNDKAAMTSQGQEIERLILPGDSILQYRIRFQNTGSDTAFNIFVRDTLDPKLDIMSIQTLGASHNYNFVINDTFVEWYFPNILLEDSTRNEPKSHGYIIFEIKYDPNLPSGTIFNNKADIYFDFNVPVETNTTETVICDLITAGFTTAPGGTTFAFSDNSTTAVSWLWDFGDGNTATTQNPSHTYSGGTSYNVCLIATNACGRSDTTCSVVNLCASGPPAAAFSQVQTGVSVDFTDNSTNTPSSWFWDFGDGNTSTAQNPTHAYAGPGTYTVCMTSDNGCGIDSSCTVIVITCTAPAPAFSWVTGPNSASFTDGSSGTFTSWFWDFGDGNTSTAQNPSHTYASPGAYNVCLVLSGSCGTDSICNTVNVFCNPPAAGWSFTPNMLAVSFSNASGNSTNWFWDFGDGNTSNLASPTHIFGSTGTYTVCMIATNSCGSDTLCQNISVSCPAPNANFSYSGGLAGMNFIDLTGNAPTSWFWDFGDGNTSTAQNPSHTYSAAGNYTVCLRTSSNCGADSLCLPIVLTEIAVGDALTTVSVFPNPVNDMLHVVGESPAGTSTEMVLRDVTGRTVSPVWQNESDGNFRNDISVAHLPSGIYFLEIRIGDQILNRKVVKE